LAKYFFWKTLNQQRLDDHVKRFSHTIEQSLACFPSAIAYIIARSYNIVSDGGMCPPDEARTLAADLESGNCCTPNDFESANKLKADLTPAYLQMSTNRQLHRAPICSPENCYFPVESVISNTNSSSGKATLYQANLKYLADQSNIQMQTNSDGQPVNGKA
jgi:hypothetical protein